MTVKYPTQCAACARLREKVGTCDAFPGGIPKNIFMFGEDHRTPRRGDHGLQFQQKPGAEAQRALDDWLWVNEGGSGSGGN